MPQRSREDEQEITALLIQYAIAARRGDAAALRQLDQRPAGGFARVRERAALPHDRRRRRGAARFALVLSLAAGLSIFIALYNAMEERRYDLAIMRTLGASPGKLMACAARGGWCSRWSAPRSASCSAISPPRRWARCLRRSSKAGSPAATWLGSRALAGRARRSASGSSPALVPGVARLPHRHRPHARPRLGASMRPAFVLMAALLALSPAFAQEKKTRDRRGQEGHRRPPPARARPRERGEMPRGREAGEGVPRAAPEGLQGHRHRQVLRDAPHALRPACWR